VNGSYGPFMLVGARSFGRIAAMRLTAARSPLLPNAAAQNIVKKGGKRPFSAVCTYVG
jgi:hypothetical protein